MNVELRTGCRALAPLLCCVVMAGCMSREDVAPSNQGPSPIEVMYVANEGVLIESGRHKLLIDALFDDPNPLYAAPTADVLEQIESGRAPFDGVDLALVTHNHADHFAPGPAVRFLEQNPEARLVAAVDAVDAMREVAGDWQAIADRVVPIELEPGVHEDRTVGEIDLRIFRTLHSGNRESPQNLMYLVDLDGRTIFHEGDSDGSLATFARLELGVERVDLALVHFWFPTNPDGARVLEKYVPADHVGLIHLPIELNEEYPGRLETVAANHADLFLFVERGERRTLD